MSLTNDFPQNENTTSAVFCFSLPWDATPGLEKMDNPVVQLTLIYPTHFEDVQCQSGVNHIYEG